MVYEKMVYKEFEENVFLFNWFNYIIPSIEYYFSQELDHSFFVEGQECKMTGILVRQP